MKDAKVHSLQLSAARATKLINEIAKETGKVILGDHSLQQMDTRGISDTEVYRILQLGFVYEAPVRTELKEWKCKVVRSRKGHRDQGVVTIILEDGFLFAMTVEWEDRR